MRSLRFSKMMKTGALLAAMAVVIAAGGADAATLSDAARSYLITAKAEEAVEASEVDSDNTKLLDDCFGEVVMYRWTQMTYEDAAHRFPEDDALHPLMMIWPSGYYLAGKAPDCIWSSENSTGAVPGIDKTHYMPNTIDYWTYFEDDGDLEADETYFIDCRKTLGDTQIDTTKRAFYTSDDRNVVSMHYTGKKDSDNHNEHDGSEAILVQLKLKSDNGTDYWIHPENDECITIQTTEPSDHPWRLEQCWRNYGSAGKNYDFDVAYNRSGDDGVFRIFAGWGHIQDDFDVYMPIIYLGEKMRFSKIMGGTTVTENSVLSITPSRYISTEGEGEPATGVILPEGDTLVVEKGGVLSVSGRFINNGTIIVNKGGTVIIRDGGSIFPFLQGNDTKNNGCGRILCNGGDIIIKEGGALFAGLQDEALNDVSFRLDNGATLVNMGLMVYGKLQLGTNARVELHDTAVTYGGVAFCYYKPTTFKNDMISCTVLGTSDYQKMEMMPADYINTFMNTSGFQFTEKVEYSYHCAGNMYQYYYPSTKVASHFGMIADTEVGNAKKYHVMIAEGAEDRLNDPYLNYHGIKTETMGI